MADRNRSLLAKRRKLDAATKTLMRPFTSPLRAATAGTHTKRVKPLAGQLETIRLGRLNPYLPSTSAHTVPITALAARSPTSQTCHLLDDVQTVHQHRPPRTIAPLVPSYGTGTARTTVQQLQKEIKAVRTDIDIMQHAVALRTSGQLERVAKLIDKWRTVAQSAAEEVFPEVKNRVEGQGGTAVLRHRKTMSYFEVVHGDKDEQRNSLERNYHHSDEPASKRAANVPASNERYAEDGLTLAPTSACTEIRGSDEDEGCSFTMEQMLCYMNIDLALIGYDNAMQQWKS